MMSVVYAKRMMRAFPADVPIPPDPLAEAFACQSHSASKARKIPGMKRATASAPRKG
jgi:hypothetical protein